MKASPETIIAVHPHWVSRLILSPDRSTLRHEEAGSTGSYEIKGPKLIVKWDKYESESFTKVGDNFIHDTILDGTCPTSEASAPELRKLAAAKLYGHVVGLSGVTAVVPGHNYHTRLQLLTTDVPTFFQVFLVREYDSPDLPTSANCVLDLGANIGLASVFFGLKYPNAQIVAVEPDPENFDALEYNTRSLGSRVSCKHAAAWSEDGTLGLVCTDAQGKPLGSWGVQTEEPKEGSVQHVKCYSIPSLMSEFGGREVDILKIDVEGAELELFSENVSAWLPYVKLITIETHERFRPGSEIAVRKAVAGAFEELPRVGENLFFRRK